MSLPLLVFFILAATSVAGALMLILAKEPIHSALALILVMVALASLYLLLGAEFIAAVQIIVYAGAIMVLFVFVIMLLNAGTEERTDWSQLAKYAGLPLGIFFMLWLAHWMAHSGVGAAAASSVGTPVANSVALATDAASGAFSTRALSEQLFRTYLFPFEATSILILIAILGALVLAKRDE